MKTTFQECYEGYSETNEDKTAFYEPGWRFVDNSTRDADLFRLCSKPWRYQNAEEIKVIAGQSGDSSHFIVEEDL